MAVVLNRSVVGILAAGLLLFAGVPTSSAQAPTTGYGSWAVSGDGASWAGVFTPPSVAGFPSASLATNSLSPATPTGATTWLGPTTTFGAVFGSSQDLPYIQLRTTTGTTTSTTTITFGAPTPAQVGGSGWGFTLGDIDADQVTLSATDANGDAITAGQLGWQGAFNYCAVSPKPSGCPSGESTDVPTWDPNTATLTGNVLDSGGASGWFRPTTPLATLTLVFTPLSGLPTFQLWIAAAGGVSLGGTALLQVDDDTPTPVAGAIVELLDASGDPVTVAGVPVATVTASDGTYRFDNLVPSPQLTVRVSTGPVGGQGDVLTVDADLTGGSVDDADVLFQQFTPPTTSTTSTTSTVPASTTTAPTTSLAPDPTTPTTAVHPAGSAPSVRSGGVLPATGASLVTTMAVGLPLMVTGGALALAAGRRRGGRSPQPDHFPDGPRRRRN